MGFTRWPHEPNVRSLGTGHAVMLGDVVGSRQWGGWAQSELVKALRDVADRIPAVQQPSVTIGDEFQAVYSTVAEALHSSLLCRLLLAERGMDSRYGVAWGQVLLWAVGTEPYGQDGAAWWAAREALESLDGQSQHHAAPQLRTVIRVLEPDAVWSSSCTEGADHAPPSPGQLSLPDLDRTGVARASGWSVEPMLQGLLYARDTVTDPWDRRDRLLYLALDSGESLSTAAGVLGITPSAASLRSRRNGIYSVLHLERHLHAAFRRTDSSDG